MPSNYLPGQVLTAAELNASLDAKVDSDNAQITGGQLEGIDHVYVTGTDSSTDPTSGALTVDGGVGIGENLNVQDDLGVGGNAAITGNLNVGGLGAFAGRLTSLAKIMGVNGANLLSNSSAEFSNLGWATSVFAAAVGANGQGGLFTNTGSILTPQQDYSNPITIGAAVAVVIAAEINASGVTSGRAFVALEAFNASNVSLGVFARAVATNGTGYANYWVAGTTPASTASVKVAKGVDTAPNVSVGGLSFRRIKFETGTVPSLYSQEASVASVAGNANGELTLDVSAADVTLTVDQASNGIFKFIGTLTGNRTITYPATPHAFVVQNLTTGLFTLTIKAAGQTPSATVVQGKSATLFSDATGVYATSSAAGLSFAGVNAFSGNQSLTISNIGNIITQSAASITTFPKANTIPAGSGFGFANVDTNSAHVVQLALQAGDTADLTFPFNTAINDVFFWYSDGISKWKLGWYSNKFNPIFEGLLTVKGGITMSGGVMTFPDGSVQTSANSGTAPVTTIYSVAAANVTLGATTIVTTTGFAAPFVNMFRNGIHMAFGVDFTLSGDNKTINLLTNPVSVFDEFEVLTGFTYNPSTVYIPTSTLYTPIVGATGIAATYTPGFAYLYRNGVRLVPGVDYTALDGANVTFIGFTGDGVTQYELWLFIPLTPANAVSNTAPVISAPLTFQDGTVQATAARGFKNWVFNGDMSIWQRGVSFSNVTTYTADRWQTYRAGLATGAQVFQIAGTGVTGFYYGIGVQRTAGNTNTSTIYASQSWETIDVRKFAGKTVTLSYYAYGNGAFVGSAFGVFGTWGTGTNGSVAGGFTGATNVGAISTPLTAGWQFIQQTFTIPSNATQFGISFSVIPTAVAAGANDFFGLTRVQLEVSPVATEFEQVTYTDSLTRCKRYFQVFSQPLISGYNVAGALVYQDFFYPVQMARNPNASFTTGSLTYSNANSFAVNTALDYSVRLQIAITASGYGFAYGAAVSLNAEL